MSIISFFKEAGEKLFGGSSAAATPAAAPAAPDPAQVAALNQAAAKAIGDYIATQGLTAEGLALEFDGASSTVSVSGIAADQATKEKIVLCCGNVRGVAGVNDLMTVQAPADESRWYTVVRGDTLSKISKDHYGNANEYMKIFEANKPMLGHPDKIYPGQLLRVPA
ncbi:MAG TPA: peptidoglycan-binding protein LysM [Ideonella sp.]|nr:peptidoglycan-binding protein LysM [Ideonella sp.]